MKKRILLASLLSICLSLPAFAGQDPAAQGVQDALNTFEEGCRQELTTFCKDVTPGEGRILACLYAFQDKVSPHCEFALYDSLSQLDRTLNNLTFVVGECQDDLEQYCADIEPGEGRLLDCLKKKESKVSQRCNKALETAGYKN